jgi:hypothetical protein
VELPEPCPGCKFAGIKFPKPEPDTDTGGSEAEGSKSQSGRREQ